MQLERTLKLKRVEDIENGKSVLFLGDYITKYKDKITLKSKDNVCGQHARDAGVEGCKPTNTPMVRKESAANGDEEMLEGSEDETYRSVVGLLMYFKRHRFDLHNVAKTLAHKTSEASLAPHSRNAGHASGIDSSPRTADGKGWLV